MKVAVSTIGRFRHLFVVGAELARRGELAAFYTAYAKPLLREDRAWRDRMRTFPWLHMPYMAAHRLRLMTPTLNRLWDRVDHAAFDGFVARRLPGDLDIFHGLSGHNLRAGLQAKKGGAKYICDRSSAHIRVQDELIRSEADRIGVRVAGVDPRGIEQEMAEYAAADRIMVPSEFARRTFLESGFDPARVWSVPLGIDSRAWRPLPAESDGKFRVLYFGSISLRKGVHDLLRAFELAALPNSELVLLGAVSPELACLVAGRRDAPNIRFLGHFTRQQALEWCARSTVFVLPSIEDGFGLVILEAQACGLPVIATCNSGGPDAITDGVNGYVVPIRAPEAIAERLTRLQREPELARGMRARSLEMVGRLAGWETFAQRVVERYRELLD